MPATDDLAEFDDVDLLDISIHALSGAQETLQAALNSPDEAITLTAAIRRSGGVLGAVIEALTELRHRAIANTLSDPVLKAAQAVVQGRISQEQFTDMMVQASFAVYGVEPTEAQYQQRRSEFDLVNSFVGRG